MLINFNPNETLYVIGTGVPAVELKHWIQAETSAEIKLIDRQELYNLPKNSQCIPGFANRSFRLSLILDSVCENLRWISYIHPTSVILTGIEKISNGTVIQPMVTVGYEASIGPFGWITPYCLVSHGDVLGSNVVLSPRVIVGGSTTIGDNVTVGIGTIVSDRINICSDCEFIMSSVVTKSIDQPGKYYGNKKTVLLSNNDSLLSK